MTAAPLPVVDPRRCTGCGWCVAVCPTVCLAMSHRVPWLRRPADCVRCGACGAVCPVEAVSLVPPAADRYDAADIPGAV